MPLTIPSVEFTGVLGDVLSFALDDPDFPDLCCVRIHWDGEQLHTQAHDGTHVGWSRWSADDDPVGADAQESYLEPWGGADDPWAIIVTLEDAKLLVKMFKVKKELFFTPLQVDHVAGNLRITRNRVPGLMAISTTVDGHPRTFPDIALKLAEHDRADAVRTIAFTAAQLAHFADVRVYGPMEVTFTGTRGPALVHIGNRFTGAITPVRQAAEQGLKAVA